MKALGTMSTICHGPVPITTSLLQNYGSRNHHADCSPLLNSSKLLGGLGEVGESVTTLELAVLNDTWISRG